MPSTIAEENSVITSLAKVAERLRPLSTGTRWYVFGSMKSNKLHYSDVDVLLVYEHGDIARVLQLRDALEDDIETPKPLDLVVLSVVEEVGVQFIKNESARLIWPDSVPRERGAITDEIR